MNVNIFTFCDSAHIYNEKLVIVGTFNAIDSPSFPFRPTALSLVLSISIDKSESGHYDGKLRIYKKGTDVSLVESLIPIDVSFPDETNKAYVNFFGSLNGILIPEPGIYTAEISIGGFSREIDLYVKESKK